MTDGNGIESARSKPGRVDSGRAQPTSGESRRGAPSMPATSPTSTPTQADPTLAVASSGAWRAWLAQLVTAGRSRLAALGIALVLGFGAGLVTLYLFAALATTVAEGDTERVDFAVLAWLRERQSPILDSVAWYCSLLGSEVLAVLLVLMLGAFAFRRRWGAAVALLLVTVGAQLENNVLKDLFQRARPAPVTGLIPAQAFSFPSGHAMVAAAFYAFMVYLSWRLLRGWLRVACVAALVLVVLLVGVSRLYLGVHYFTDVVAGYMAGLFWTNAVVTGGALLTRRRRSADSASVGMPMPIASTPSAPAIRNDGAVAATGATPAVAAASCDAQASISARGGGS